MSKVTTDGEPPDEGCENTGAPKPIDPKTGQHKAYWVLSEEERKSGQVRPVRQKYIHKVCGGETQMSLKIAETYAKNPKFYGSTFCINCGQHYPVDQFHWSDSDELVGS